MKTWLRVILYLLATIIFLAIIALATRMHIFLAIPVTVIAIFGFAWAQVFIER